MNNRYIIKWILIYQEVCMCAHIPECVKYSNNQLRVRSDSICLLTVGKITEWPNWYVYWISNQVLTFGQKGQFLEVAPFSLFSGDLACLCWTGYMHFLNCLLRFLPHNSTGICSSVSKDSVRVDVEFQDDMLMVLW
jgi:hypothetical protein